MLPKALEVQLETFAQTDVPALPRLDPSAIVAEIDKLQATTFASAQDAIARVGMLDQRHRFTLAKILGHQALLKSSPLWAHLFIHHRDGYLRAGALDRLAGPARNVFEVMAIAYRLNDWVEPVRRKAEACARRVLPTTDPDMLAAAALVLSPRLSGWSRWPRQSKILGDTLGAADVVRRFATAFRQARSGPISTMLRAHLRQPALDGHLVELAQDAFLPGIRSIALQALIEGHVCWPTGYTSKWIDKSYGRSRRVAVYTRRHVAQPGDLATLIARALDDRAVVVRRTALNGLIRLRDQIPDSAVLDRLASDRSPSIRERAVFLRRTL